VLAGGAFLYAFRFPPMCVGRHEVFWQRPLAACACPERGTTQLLDVELPGYITAYDSERDGYERPVELYPRLLRRPHFVDALLRIDRSKDYYRYQTALNVVNVFDMAQRWGGGRLPREFTEQMLRTRTGSATVRAMARSRRTTQRHPRSGRAADGCVGEVHPIRSAAAAGRKR
jgi:hypothetical protein